MQASASTVGSKGAFAQAYSLFDAAMGLATVAGPGRSGLLKKTKWQITARTLAVLCTIGGVPVLGYMGEEAKEERKEAENRGVSVA